MADCSEFIPLFEKFCADNKCFYFYKLPHSKIVKFGCAANTSSFSRANSTKGFLVSKFMPGSPVELIPCEDEFTFSLDRYSMPDFTAQSDINISDDKVKYIKTAEKIIARLKERGGKTVFCRQIDVNLHGYPIEIFLQLCKKYESAMVFCWRHPHSNGTWVGATPELLLEANDEVVETMALAGTRPSNSSTIKWDNKNLNEQQIVVDFIDAILKKYCDNVEIGHTMTRQAGPVEHICTPIKAKLTPQTDLVSLLKNLSPTPALSGYPRNDALNDISEFEYLPRDYYGGFCGPLLSESSFQLYVILRCMRISDSVSDNSLCKAVIFAGGGLTPLSDSEDEWNETCYKASTIIDIITKQQ